MIHLGDITKIDGGKVPIVDIVCGGSPCQDLSVAGKRAGLQGARSGLFMEQIRIIKELRNECIRQFQANGTAVDLRCVRPRYMVWENVPGAFSSNKGEDFRAVLEETARIADENAVIPEPPKGRWSNSGAIMGDGWSIAWRVHDAQFWGVPQRRRRIALVADFGGESAPEILFEREGVSGDFEPGEQERKETPGDSGRDIETSISFQERAGKPGGGKGILIQNDRIGALSTIQNQSVLGLSRERCGAVVGEDIAPTIQAAAGESGNNQPMVLTAEESERTVYGISSYDSNAMKSPNPHSGIYKAETARTLDNNGGNPACNQGGMIVIEGNGSRESHKGPGFKESDISYTLNSTEQHAVCCETIQDKTGPLMASGYQKLGTQEAKNGMYVVQSMWNGEDVAPTLTSNNASGAQRMPDKDNFNAVIQTCVGVDTYNQSVTGDKAKSITSRATDSDHLPCIAIDRASFNQGQNAQYDFSVEEEVAQTLVSRGPGGGTKQTIGALCARDYKGVGSQYVDEGKVIVQGIEKK